MRLAFPLLFLLLADSPAPAQTVTVKGGKRDATHVIVAVAPGGFGYDATANGVMTPAQTDGETSVVLLPLLKAGGSATVGPWKPEPNGPRPEQPQLPFVFKETKGEHLDLFFTGRPVLRFVDKPHDANDHYLTFKPFHQMFDPKDGKTLLSSGAHPNTKEFLFPHHRGLFFGFNKISYGDKQTADIWHGTDNVFSTTDKILEQVSGRVFARHTAAISWHGKDGKTFADEKRTVTVYSVPGGTLLEWTTELSTSLDSVKLDGDPQHAGFHFRATQEVSKSTAKQTYYLRPDGKGKEGETRNWDVKGKDAKTVDLPWNAMSFVTNEKRYTVLRVPHPDNPKTTRGSERDYGRFGDYFEYELTPKTPLKLKYRIWLQEGEMTGEQCEAITEGFKLSK